MAITGANIRADLNTRLSRSEIADAINVQITDGLNALARVAIWPDLRASSNLSFVADDKSKALPSDFRVVDELCIADYDPLLPKPFDNIREAQEASGSTTGRPEYYSLRGGEAHVYRIPDQAYTVVLKYYKLHATVADETAALSFGDEYRKAITLATMVEYLGSVAGLTETHPKMVETVGLFNREVGLLLPMADTDMVAVAAYEYGS